MRNVRNRTLDLSKPPKQWQNGSEFYREGKAHTKNRKHLLGKTFRRGGSRVAAWLHIGVGKYIYLGEYKTDLDARMAISRRA